MATQSLYRRYRPRRFSELKGQDHIVKALRTSVAEGREGQAYLFSGPRGTGKTSSARILAKVLNCQNPEDGEPCCECDSCLAVEKGTSYDVHELDAASNNGVDAMRDLIEKASLGTPGRHKVYILDEVHMLSKGAEAALLKTLEEPPPHVVFVLATTDPQKMSDTIRSRTQHLQFHLLGADALQEHVRWVAHDAGLTVTDDAIEQVIAQGGGSPRDTLSALELVASTGGDATDVLALDEFVEAMIDGDPGRGLTMAAQAVSRGRDPRTITEELIGFLRNGFLSLMAPDLVQLPSQRLDGLTDLSRRLGAAGLVRGIEHLGAALNEMRQAPDPRVLLDVAIVQLTSDQAASDVAGLAARVQKLERRLADGVAPPPAAAAAAPVVAEPAAAPVDETTGKRKLGSRAAAAAPASQPAAASAQPAPAPEQQATMVTPGADSTSQVPPDSTSATEPPTDVEDPSPPAAASSGAALTAAQWDEVRPSLRGMARAVFSPATFVDAGVGTVTLGLPNDAHRQKCEQHRPAVEQAIGEHLGAAVGVELVVSGGGAGGGDDPSPSTSPGSAVSSGDTATGSDAPQASGTPTPGTPSASGAPSATMSTSGALAHDSRPDSAPGDVVPAHLSVVPNQGPEVLAGEVDDDVTSPVDRVGVDDKPVVGGRAIADQARANGPAPDPDAGLQTLDETLPDDDEVDLDDLIDAPPESVKTPIDRLAEAFPGSELVDDTY